MDRHDVALVWLRRDLRLDDNVALFAAAQAARRVVCAFVLDPDLLRGPRVGAPIVQFFFESLRELRERLREHGSDLVMLEGEFGAELLALARRVGASALFYNRDYDPAAAERDAGVERRFHAANLAVAASTDHVYFGAGDVLQDGGKPYTVYTPYRRRWQARFAADPRPPVASEQALRGKLVGAGGLGSARPIPAPADYGLQHSALYPRAGATEAHALLARFTKHGLAAYAQRRNVPAQDGTSHLSPHLRAGTIGIRTVVHAAAAHDDAEVWLGELVWRDFYAQLLAHHPRVAASAFVAAADTIAYSDDEAAFAAWCEGETGYPIVDAAMRQLNTTGWMHNRLRMIAASFLTKHLLVDYRRGERYFEQHLADADLASNNGGWQWSASTGTDAAPYFRVFSPILQGKTFDRDGAFVKSMLPALRAVPSKYLHEPWTMPEMVQQQAGCVIGRDYPSPIVEHRWARARAIDVYGAALGKRLALPASVKS